MKFTLLKRLLGGTQSNGVVKELISKIPNAKDRGQKNLTPEAKKIALYVIAVISILAGLGIYDPEIYKIAMNFLLEIAYSVTE